MADPEALPEHVDAQAADRLRAGGALLVDVREQHEYDAGHVPEALHIPFASLSAQAERVSRDVPVVFVCRSGGRSAVATQVFRSAGYDAHNLDGGMLQWVATGLAIEPSDGHVADH